jgi:hypothetical protein
MPGPEQLADTISDSNSDYLTRRGKQTIFQHP